MCKVLRLARNTLEAEMEEFEAQVKTYNEEAGFMGSWGKGCLLGIFIPLMSIDKAQNYIRTRDLLT